MIGEQPAWSPRYTITPGIARSLMAIEAARAVVERAPLPPTAEAELLCVNGNLSAIHRQLNGNGTKVRV